MGEFEVEI